MVTERGPLTIEGSTVVDIESKAVGDTLRVTVVPPLLYESFGQSFPTLYVLDANLCLPMASSIARTLQMVAFGAMPPVMCVGVGYATDNLLDVMALRTRDLTPTEGELPPSPIPMNTYGMGGASRLLDSLTEEVFPRVEESWRSDAEDRCVVGWSFGGLFGLHALFNRPEAFRRYLLMSPSIWWSDQAILEDEESYASTHDDLAAEVFLAAGEREEAAPSRMWPPVPEEMAETAMEARMVSSLDELVERLRSRRYSNLKVSSEVFTDEHHATIFPAGFTRGLVSLYAG
jgi:uncharacterized protein